MFILRIKLFFNYITGLLFYSTTKAIGYMNATFKKWILSLATVGIISLPQTAWAQSGLFDDPQAGVMSGMGNDIKDIVKLNARFTPPAGKQPAILFITAEIKRGWHIYSITQEPGGPIRTEIELAQSPRYRLAGEFKSQPKPKKEKEPDAFGDLPIEIHSGRVTWYAPLELAPGTDPVGLIVKGKVSFQACDAKSCLPPGDVAFSALQGAGIKLPGETPAAISPGAESSKTTTSVRPSETAVQGAGVKLPVETQAAIAPGAEVSKNTTPVPPSETGNTLWMQLGFAFLGGLILNLMPCVLPVISLKIFSFLQQAGEHRSRVFVLNLWYSLGLLSVFMVLAALAATAGLAWGEQFTLPWFKVAMTALVFVMALSFLGVWEIPIPGFVGVGKASELQAQEGPSGAFFKGVFATILATPCSGPFLGPVFGYLLQQPPYMAYWIFGAVGLGMASPYLVIGAFPELIRFLPKPGRWMETVKQLMAFLLLATVVYLFSTLSSAYFVPTLTLLVGLVVRLLVDRTHAFDRGNAFAGCGMAGRIVGGRGGGLVCLHGLVSAVENRLAAVFARGPGPGTGRGQDRDGRFLGRLVFNLQDQLEIRHRNRCRARTRQGQRRGSHAGRLDRSIAHDQEGPERSGLQFHSRLGHLARQFTG